MTIRDRLAGGPLGFGAAPLGNMFRELTDEEAAATVDAAWQHGTRFFDTAPQYGAGLSEIRLGTQLAKHDRDEYELSTKVAAWYSTNSRPGHANSVRRVTCSAPDAPTAWCKTIQRKGR